MRKSSTLVVTALLAVGLGGTALGQEVAATDRSIASGRDTIIEGDVYQGATEAEVEDIIRQIVNDSSLLGLVEAAARGASIEANAKVRELGDQLDLRRQALAKMFEILGRERVPPERLADTLAAVATRQKGLLERVRLLDASDPRAIELRDKAAAAIEGAEYERADELMRCAALFSLSWLKPDTRSTSRTSATALMASNRRSRRKRRGSLTGSPLVDVVDVCSSRSAAG